MSVNAATDSQIIEWIGNHVTQINSLQSKGRGERVELICADGNRMEIVVRSGKTISVAFRKCAQAGMRKMPNNPA